jgi:hypothetical protein
LFPKFKTFLTGRKYKSRQALVSAIHQYLITLSKSPEPLRYFLRKSADLRHRHMKWYTSSKTKTLQYW